MEEILKEQLRPTAEEIETIAEVLREVSMVLSRFGEVQPMGSYAKGTLLRGKKEADLFVLVEKGKDLHKLTHDMRDALSKYETRLAFASHPYLQVFSRGIRVDVVPSYKITSAEDLESAVDRTQLHVKFINENITEDQRDEVRLLKQFLKNLNAYGAEIRYKGFSGYLCELLVLKFGTFRNVLKHFAHFDGLPITFNGISESFEDPLVVIDPVDPKRNVASPVGLKSLSKLVAASRSYLKFPSKDFFFFDGKEKPNFHIISVSFQSPDAVEDMRFGVLRKLASKLSKHLASEGFDVVDYWVFEEKGRDVAAIGVLEARVLSRFIRPGPPINKTEDFFKFLHKNSSAVLSEEGPVSVSERPCSYVLDCVNKFLSTYELKLYDKELALTAEDVSLDYVEREMALNSFILDILHR